MFAAHFVTLSPNAPRLVWSAPGVQHIASKDALRVRAVQPASHLRPKD